MRLQAASENRAKALDEAARPAMLERQKHVLLKHQKLCAGRTRGKMTQHDRLDGRERADQVGLLSPPLLPSLVPLLLPSPLLPLLLPHPQRTCLELNSKFLAKTNG